MPDADDTADLGLRPGPTVGRVTPAAGETFRAFVLDETAGKVSGAVRALARERLPPGDVLVRVSHSTLNYKDGLVIRGLGRIVKTYPHVPGVNLAGTVVESESPAWRPGDHIVLTGMRTDTPHWGGFAELARVRGEWLVPRPSRFTAAETMAIGGAGATAMLAAIALEEHGLRPGDGEVLVTGASGGLGSCAVAILATLGHPVVAATGRPDEAEYLAGLGASRILPRADLLAGSSRGPLGSARWAAAIDAVGGAVLAAVLAQLKPGSAVAACGNAAGNDVPANVLPFLLRGVRMIGIDSVMIAIERKRAAWARLARDLPADCLGLMTETIGLDGLPDAAERILAGRVRGRIVVDTAR